jgi:cell division protein ZapA
MATVTVDVNGRAYSVGCEDGQEAHVASLARHFDSQVNEVAAAVGQVGELRLFLMAALLTADELADTRERLKEVEAENARLRDSHAAIETAATRAVATAAARIEDMVARIED